MLDADDEQLLAHLVASRLAGRVATSATSSLTNAKRLVDGDPDCTMGLSDWKDATYREVLAAVHASGGTELEEDAAEHPDGGYIDPEATLEAIKRHKRGLTELLSGGGGRVLLATGHPSLLAHYGRLAAALATAGCPLVRPLHGREDGVLTTPDGRPCSIAYVDEVAVLSYEGGQHHTHRSQYMEAMLDAVGGDAGVDLVVADHGYAGAAIEAGIPTLSIADVNDPALPLAQARGRTDGVLLIDDGLSPSLFAPVTDAILG
ncbi:MAG: phosphatase [Actinomycetota bacterium]|nr:phosphatase [Actinomycetota bacterium]